MVYMPQEWNRFIASFTVSGEIAIYSIDDNLAEGKGPVKELKSGHQKEGFGICWNPSVKG
jgi:hypothetical protein